MKILQCHNVYQQAGGEDCVVRDEKSLLESHGHTVIDYIRHNDEVNEMGKLSLAINTVWSRRSIRELRSIIREHRPDIAHFHNTLPLMSPAVYQACRAEGVPVVQTLHNYRLLCPKATFFRDNQVCEECLHKSFKWPAIKHGCYRDSRAASAAVSVLLTTHGLIGTYRKHIDAFIACSGFTRDKMVEGGLPGERIHVKPNFMTSDPGVGSGDGGHALWLGRLSEEKGVAVVSDAWDQLDPSIRLEVIGTGPLVKDMDALCDRRPNVHRHGWVEDQDVARMLNQASFMVLAAMSYEGFPKVVVEAYANGLPVIGTDSGSLSSLIVEGVTGRKFRYGDADHLAQIVRELHNDPEQLARLRRGAREAYETQYTADANYQLMMDIYGKATQRLQETTNPKRLNNAKALTPVS